MTQFRNNFMELLADKSRREGRIIDVSDVSREAGIAYTTVKRWEEGDITRFDMPVIEKLCIYFNCSMSQLVEYSPPRSSQNAPQTAMPTAQIAALS